MGEDFGGHWYDRFIGCIVVLLSFQSFQKDRDSQCCTDQHGHYAGRRTELLWL